MLKKLKKIIVITLVFIICGSVSVSAKEAVNSSQVPYENYTYWTGIASETSRKAVPMRALYEVDRIINTASISQDGLDDMQDIYCSPNGYVYILDSKIPSITILDWEYNYQKTINALTDENGQSVSFKGSKGIFVTEEEHIYICGTESACVWKCDTAGNILETLYLPDADIIPTNFNYAPIKVAVDTNGYVYVLSDGSYYGAILYSPNSEFLGFYGANKVPATVTQIFTTIWDRLFVNDTKKEASVKSLPYQFTDLDVGKDNFIYTATGKTEANATGQVKILNPAGIDVLDASSLNFADTESIKYGSNHWKIQNLSQIAADDDYLYVLDTGNGKIYLYDIEANLIGVFGGGTTYGDVKGTYTNPIAMALNGDDVLVCDKSKQTITVYGITEYGALVKECQRLTLNSKFEEAYDGWMRVLAMDNNSQLAYRGIGKAHYRMGNYEQAMEYSKIGADRNTYAQAYKNVRKQLINDNFAWAFPLLIILVAAVVVFSIIKKKKQIRLIKNETFSHYLSSLLHPFEAFAAIKEKKKGSVKLSVVLVALLYVTSVLQSMYSGFIYNYFDTSTFNSLFILVKTVGIVVLWSLVNWAVCTLLGGIGKIKEIFIVLSYSLTPLIISNVLYLVFTNVLLPEEAEFLGIMVTVFWIYTIFMLVAGSLKIHDIGFGSFVGTSVLTILGIAIVIFLCFLLGLMLQQLGSFGMTIFNEIIYR